ncbi:LegC family aminotransferase [Aeribacillus pallidus]|jgi:perosamine synthetase|uniref:LegC family aminotransferase n=1 Tax=Aeribacillus pallidus TaxID=33936 RepID=UPI00241437D6|nr:LegC family aminotransferase [Aeribacillus pallidus]
MMSEEKLTLIVEKLKEVLPEKEFIPLHEPSFMGNEWKYLKDCVDTGWVSSAGKYVELFEQKLADFIGVKRAVAVVNGTAALHIALKIVGVMPNDEVLIPSLTFVATGNAVVYCGATPHFVDVEERTLGLDPNKLNEYLDEIADVKNGECYNKITGRRIKAVVPMHTFGHPVDIDPLIEVCKKYHLKLVEDAAESLGSYYKGKHTGNFGIASAFSFNGNKIITTGGGGAIVTNDEKLADLAKHLTTTAKIPHRWEYVHDMIGYNYRMPNINAALGCAQLEQLPKFIKKKRELAKKYKEAFRDIAGVSFFEEANFSKSNYWLNTLILEESFEFTRDELLKALNESGIMSRPIWHPLHLLKMYKYNPKMDLSMTEKLSQQIINIPSSMSLWRGANE